MEWVSFQVSKPGVAVVVRDLGANDVLVVGRGRAVLRVCVGTVCAEIYFVVVPSCERLQRLLYLGSEGDSEAKEYYQVGHGGLFVPAVRLGRQ